VDVGVVIVFRWKRCLLIYRVTVESNDIDQLRESLGLAPKPLAIIIRRKPVEEPTLDGIDPRIVQIAKKLISSAK